MSYSAPPYFPHSPLAIDMSRNGSLTSLLQTQNSFTASTAAGGRPLTAGAVNTSSSSAAAMAANDGDADDLRHHNERLAHEVALLKQRLGTSGGAIYPTNSNGGGTATATVSSARVSPPRPLSPTAFGAAAAANTSRYEPHYSVAMGSAAHHSPSSASASPSMASLHATIRRTNSPSQLLAAASLALAASQKAAARATATASPHGGGSKVAGDDEGEDGESATSNSRQNPAGVSSGVRVPLPTPSTFEGLNATATSFVDFNASRRATLPPPSPAPFNSGTAAGRRPRDGGGVINDGAPRSITYNDTTLNGISGILQINSSSSALQNHSHSHSHSATAGRGGGVDGATTTTTATSADGGDDNASLSLVNNASLTALELQLQRYRERVITLERTVEEKDALLLALEKQAREQHDASHLRLRQLEMSLSTTMVAAEEEKGQLVASVAATETSRRALEGANKRLEEEWRRAAGEAMALQSEVTTAKGRQMEAEAALSRYNTEREAMQSKIAFLTTENTTIQQLRRECDQLRGLRDDVATLRQTVADSERELATERTKRREGEKQIFNLEQRLQAEENKRRQLETDLRSSQVLAAEKGAAEREVDTLSAANTLLRSEVEEYRRAAAAAKEVAREASHDREALMATVQGQLLKLRQDVQSSYHNTEEMAQRATMLQREAEARAAAALDASAGAEGGEDGAEAGMTASTAYRRMAQQQQSAAAMDSAQITRLFTEKLEEQLKVKIGGVGDNNTNGGGAVHSATSLNSLLGSSTVGPSPSPTGNSNGLNASRPPSAGRQRNSTFTCITSTTAANTATTSGGVHLQNRVTSPMRSTVSGGGGGGSATAVSIVAGTTSSGAAALAVALPNPPSSLSPSSPLTLPDAPLRPLYDGVRAIVGDILLHLYREKVVRAKRLEDDAAEARAANAAYQDAVQHLTNALNQQVARVAELTAALEDTQHKGRRSRDDAQYLRELSLQSMRHLFEDVLGKYGTANHNDGALASSEGADANSVAAKKKRRWVEIINMTTGAADSSATTNTAALVGQSNLTAMPSATTATSTRSSAALVKLLGEESLTQHLRAIQLEQKREAEEKQRRGSNASPSLPPVTTFTDKTWRYLWEHLTDTVAAMCEGDGHYKSENEHLQRNVRELSVRLGEYKTRLDKALKEQHSLHTQHTANLHLQHEEELKKMQRLLAKSREAAAANASAVKELEESTAALKQTRALYSTLKDEHDLAQRESHRKRQALAETQERLEVTAVAHSDLAADNVVLAQEVELLRQRVAAESSVMQRLADGLMGFVRAHVVLDGRLAVVVSERNAAYRRSLVLEAALAQLQGKLLLVPAAAATGQQRSATDTRRDDEDDGSDATPTRPPVITSTSIGYRRRAVTSLRVPALAVMALGRLARLSAARRDGGVSIAPCYEELPRAGGGSGEGSEAVSADHHRHHHLRLLPTVPVLPKSLLASLGRDHAAVGDYVSAVVSEAVHGMVEEEAYLNATASRRCTNNNGDGDSSSSSSHHHNDTTTAAGAGRRGNNNFLFALDPTFMHTVAKKTNMSSAATITSSSPPCFVGVYRNATAADRRDASNALLLGRPSSSFAGRRGGLGSAGIGGASLRPSDTTTNSTSVNTSTTAATTETALNVHTATPLITPPTTIANPLTTATLLMQQYGATVSSLRARADLWEQLHAQSNAELSELAHSLVTQTEQRVALESENRDFRERIDGGEWVDRQILDTLTEQLERYKTRARLEESTRKDCQANLHQLASREVELLGQQSAMLQKMQSLALQLATMLNHNHSNISSSGSTTTASTSAHLLPPPHGGRRGSASGSGAFAPPISAAALLGEEFSNFKIGEPLSIQQQQQRQQQSGRRQRGEKGEGKSVNGANRSPRRQGGTATVSGLPTISSSSPSPPRHDDASSVVLLDRTSSVYSADEGDEGKGGEGESSSSSSPPNPLQHRPSNSAVPLSAADASSPLSPYDDHLTEVSTATPTPSPSASAEASPVRYGGGGISASTFSSQLKTAAHPATTAAVADYAKSNSANNNRYADPTRIGNSPATAAGLMDSQSFVSPHSPADALVTAPHPTTRASLAPPPPSAIEGINPDVIAAISPALAKYILERSGGNGSSAIRADTAANPTPLSASSYNMYSGMGSHPSAADTRRGSVVGIDIGDVSGVERASDTALQSKNTSQYYHGDDGDAEEDDTLATAEAKGRGGGGLGSSPSYLYAAASQPAAGSNSGRGVGGLSSEQFPSTSADLMAFINAIDGKLQGALR